MGKGGRWNGKRGRTGVGKGEEEEREKGGGAEEGKKPDHSKLGGCAPETGQDY